MLKRKIIAIVSLSAITLSSVVLPVTQVSVHANEISDNSSKEYVEPILYNQGTFEETSNLPLAPSTDFIGPTQRKSQRKSPSSIEDYRKLGYSNFTYSSWTGDKAYLSTKAARIAEFMVVNLTALIPGNFVRASLALYDVSQLLKDQKADIWPTSNIRNIMAKTPAGYEARIGQETKVKYYSDSKRAKLIKNVNKTYWVG